MTYHLPRTRDGRGERGTLGASGRDEILLRAPFPTPLRLPPGSYGLGIEYAALSYSAPEKVRFAFKLDGQSSDWEDIQNRRLVGFHQLQPGEYVFRVRAANNDGVWNQAGTSLAFSVLPFYWQTAWFRVGMGLSLIALGGALVWWQARRRIAQALDRERVAHELQEMRAELAHFSRVSTAGQLASALAHELGQPLGAVLRNTEAAELLIEEHPPDLAEIRAILTDIRQDDLRAAGVIDRMRALLKRRNVEREALALEEVLQEVAALVRPDQLRRKVQFTLEVGPDLPQVWGDRIQLQQVLLNLILNGMDAMTQQPSQTRRLIVRARNTQARMVEVSVRDSGSGIPAANFSRVFEPFFTTKTNGMGMGLPVSKTIVEAHQGRIWVENPPEGGACFYFTLPVVEDQTARPDKE